MDLVSIIIINWNGKNHLKKCFDSLEKLDYPNFEIILVDNNSSDESVEFTKKNYPRFKIIQNKRNLGFAKANNIGFKEAKGKYILLLNNDTKVTTELLSKLVNAIKKDRRIGIIQPKIIFMGSGKLQAGGTFLTNSGFLYHFGNWKNPNDKKYNQPKEIFSANGSCMLARREVIEKIDLFDPDFFAYFEETDFCWRTLLAGWKIIYLPAAKVYHKGGETAQKLNSSFIQFHSFKNRICSIIKNLEIQNLVKILVVHLQFCNLGSLAFLVTGKFSEAWAIQKAIWWNVWHIKKTLRKRKNVQADIRKIKDKDFIPYLKKKVRPSYYYYLFKGLEKYND
jgi:GT2 family glycosyltransferase